MKKSVPYLNDIKESVQQLIDNERELEQHRLKQAAKFQSNPTLMKEINEKFNKDRDVLRVQI
jgi:hypothetical protein